MRHFIALVLVACGSPGGGDAPGEETLSGGEAGISSATGGSLGVAQGGAADTGGQSGLAVGGSGGEGASVGGGGAAACNFDQDCGVDTPCVTRDCKFFQCTETVLDGWYVEDAPQNCQQLLCSGEEPIAVLDLSDAPPSTECVTHLCDNPPAVVSDIHFGALCTGGLCDASGSCVTCVADPGCMSWPCPSIVQASGDCLQNWCEDPLLPPVVMPDDGDVPAPVECMVMSCESGAPSSSPASAGTPCHGGNGECNGAGDCVCVSSCECTAPSHCPEPIGWCLQPACNFGWCVTEPEPDGPAEGDIPGDCQSVICTSSGTVFQANPADSPGDYECHTGICMGGLVPYFQPHFMGTPCAGGWCTGGPLSTCFACNGGTGNCPVGSHCPPLGISPCQPD